MADTLPTFAQRVKRRIGRDWWMFVHGRPMRQSQRIEDHVRRVAEGLVVNAGPFEGMKYVANQSWQWFVPYVVGGYESELHQVIEELIASAPQVVVDVGCAEGYYAVGLARRLPDSQVFAFDTDEQAQRLCADVASRNGVSSRVTVGGLCTPADLQDLVRPHSLVIVDAEGGELALLRPDLTPALASADLIIELHDFIDPSTTETIKSRFESTHRTEALITARRSPHIAWPALQGLSRRDRRKAMDERRPTKPHRMQWIVLRSRAHEIPSAL